MIQLRRFIVEYPFLAGAILWLALQAAPIAAAALWYAPWTVYVPVTQEWFRYDLFLAAGAVGLFCFFQCLLSRYAGRSSASAYLLVPHGAAQWAVQVWLAVYVMRHARVFLVPWTPGEEFVVRQCFYAAAWAAAGGAVGAWLGERVAAYLRYSGRWQMFEPVELPKKP